MLYDHVVAARNLAPLPALPPTLSEATMQLAVQNQARMELAVRRKASMAIAADNEDLLEVAVADEDLMEIDGPVNNVIDNFMSS